jgi:hypothetical protein
MSEKNNSNLPFNKFSKNIYSQNGEDGIIAEILEQLELNIGKNLWCVEFGAWDGVVFSNTFALVEKDWHAIYIEGNSERYQDLIKTAKKYSKIIPIETFVERHSKEPNSLDNILAKTNIPKDFNLLSIDIDSYDCEVWESLSNYQPKVVIIEINSSVPPGIIWRHTDKTPGNTFTATINVGEKKGYKLVCHTGNLIFVKNDLISKLNFPEKYINYPESLFINHWLPDNLFQQVSLVHLIKAIIPNRLKIVAKKLMKLLR